MKIIHDEEIYDNLANELLNLIDDLDKDYFRLNEIQEKVASSQIVAAKDVLADACDNLEIVLFTNFIEELCELRDIIRSNTELFAKRDSEQNTQIGRK